MDRQDAHPAADEKPVAPEKMASGGLKPIAALLAFIAAHPMGFWFIFWGELAERSSFYGMRTILARYLEEVMGFSTQNASVVVQAFNATVYLLPILGGFIADRYLGKYRAIVIFCVPYILGQLLMTQQDLTALWIALLLLAMGSGITKPNISPLMGMTYEQQRPGRIALRSQAFSMFYLSINIGATLSTFVLPVVRDHWGYAVAFLCPAVLMMAAFGLFASGKPFYAVETIEYKAVSDEERRERWRVLRQLGGLFLLVALFWAMFDQSPSTWTFFARDYMDLHLFGWEIAPDQLQFVNPFLILVLLPAMSFFWQWLARRGVALRPTDKMFIGFLLAIVSVALLAVAGYLAGTGQKVTAWWEVWAYVFITLAEVCISPVGLELAFSAAPPSLRSFVTACWLAVVFLGNVIDIPIVRLYDAQLKPGPYFGLMTLIMIPVTVAFLFVARRFNRTAASGA